MRNGIDCKGREWEEINTPAKRKNLSGEKIGLLNVLFPVSVSGKSTLCWLCECDCGNTIAVRHDNLTSKKHTVSCGCNKREKLLQRHNEYRDNNNIKGMKFNSLTLLSFVGIRNQEAIYRFQCDCGNIVDLPMHHVRTGNTKSCGCRFESFISSYKEDIIGERFGKLVVESYIGVGKWGQNIFRCKCDCGNYIDVTRNSLVEGNTKSCGCVVSVGENNIKRILDNSHIDNIQQYKFDDLRSESGYKLPYDFAIIDEKESVVRLIEFDGEQHIRPFDYFGGIEKFAKITNNDVLKNQYALSRNIPLVRIPYSKRDSITIDDLLGDKYLIKENDIYGY